MVLFGINKLPRINCISFETGFGKIEYDDLENDSISNSEENSVSSIKQNGLFEQIKRIKKLM